MSRWLQYLMPVGVEWDIGKQSDCSVLAVWSPLCVCLCSIRRIQRMSDSSQSTRISPGRRHQSTMPAQYRAQSKSLSVSFFLYALIICRWYNQSNILIIQQRNVALEIDSFLRLTTNRPVIYRASACNVCRARYCYGKSVCLSVCPVPVLSLNEWTYRHTFWH